MPELPDLSGIFNRTPEEIVELFRSKGNQISWNWRDTWQEAHSRSFTVAKAVNMNVLEAIRQEVDNALANGTTFRDFQRNLEPVLKKHGWWGRKEIIDKETGEVTEVQLGSPHRLKTIYRTNLNTAHAAGRFRAQQEISDIRPWWVYRAVMDASTRASHAALHNTVLRHDDPWWDSNYPPNDWGCRCIVDSLSDKQVEDRGYIKSDGSYLPSTAEEGWNYNPGAAPWTPLVPRESSLDDILPVLDGSFDIPGPIAEFPRMPFPLERILPAMRSSGESPEYYANQFLGNFDTRIGSAKVFKDVAGDSVLISEKLFQDRDGNWKFKNEREQYMHMLADAIIDPEEIWLTFLKKEGKYRLTRRYLKAYEIDGNPEGGYVVFDLIDGEWVGTTAFNPEKGLDYIQRQRYGFLRYKKGQ